MQVSLSVKSLFVVGSFVCKSPVGTQNIRMPLMYVQDSLSIFTRESFRVDAEKVPIISLPG